MGLIFPNERVYNHSSFPYFFLEFIFLLVHPSPYLKNYYYELTNIATKIRVRYHVNDMAIMIVLIRNVFYIYSLTQSTKWNSPKVRRINMLITKKNNSDEIALKIFLYIHSFGFIFYSLFLSLFIFAGLLLITERPLS